jgi:hypothetical protein
MHDYVTGRVARIEARFGDTEFKKYLDSFKFDCLIRNLTPKTVDGYFERLGYLFEYLQGDHISLKRFGSLR